MANAWAADATVITDNAQICSEVVLGFLEDILGWETGLNRDLAGVKDIYNVLNGRQL